MRIFHESNLREDNFVIHEDSHCSTLTSEMWREDVFASLVKVISQVSNFRFLDWLKRIDCWLWEKDGLTHEISPFLRDINAD